MKRKDQNLRLPFPTGDEFIDDVMVATISMSRGRKGEHSFVMAASGLMREWYDQPVPSYKEPEPISGEIVNDVKLCIDCGFGGSIIEELCSVCCVGCV